MYKHDESTKLFIKTNIIRYFAINLIISLLFMRFISKYEFMTYELKMLTYDLCVNNADFRNFNSIELKYKNALFTTKIS